VFKPASFRAESFDFVCAFHILDHLVGPDEFASECYRIIRKNGLILLVCHDVDALVNKILGGRSPVFDIEHIFLFSRKTLTKLLENAGFDVVAVGDLTNTYKVSYWLKYIPFLNKLVKFFPVFVKQYEISMKAGNIFICAQKK
jgi:SAM-dependent methyltransferase